MEEGNADRGYFGNESGNADQDVGLESHSTEDNRVREQIVQEVMGRAGYINRNEYFCNSVDIHYKRFLPFFL